MVATHAPDDLPENAAAVRHHPALHFAHVADALHEVDAHPRISRTVQLALRFSVLTAALLGGESVGTVRLAQAGSRKSGL